MDVIITLDIIIEGAVLLSVFLQEAESVVIPKVFKLDERVLSVLLNHSLHELIDEIVVTLRAISLLIQTHVEGIPQ